MQKQLQLMDLPGGGFQFNVDHTLEVESKWQLRYKYHVVEETLPLKSRRAFYFEELFQNEKSCDVCEGQIFAPASAVAPCVHSVQINVCDLWRTSAGFEF